MFVYIFFNTIKKTTDRISDDDDFNNGNIYEISNVLNDIVYIGVTCNALNLCLPTNNKESKLKRNQRSLTFYRTFNNDIRNVQIELIENFSCDDAYNLRCKQTEIIEKKDKTISINKNE
jgi:hypothetical protein